MSDVASTPGSRAHSVASGIFGRDEELRRLAAFVDALADGPGVLGIVGEPGAGKTTLFEYAISRARDAGHRVLSVRASAEETHSPGAALLDLFDGRPGEAQTPAAAAAGSFDEGRALLRELRRSAAASPVLLAVDDHDWLDTVSANALRFAANRLGAERVGLLVTSSGPGHPSAATGHRRIELGPLTPDALRQALLRCLPVITRPDLARAHERSSGNPGVALALARSWHRERQGSATFERPEPLGAQLDALPADAVELIRTLAIAGPVPIGVIARAADVEDFSAAAAAAVDAGIVLVTDDLTMRFSEQRTAHAVTARTNPLERCAIHGRLVDAITAPDARALHLGLATLVADEAVAEEIEAVAGQCAERGGYDRAAELIAQSVRLTPGSSGEAAARRRSREIAYRATSGETGRAVALADRLLADLGPGRWRATVLTQRVFLDFADSERFLRQALREVGDDLALRARMLDLLGWQLGLYRGRLQDGIACSAEALAIGRAIGDAETTALSATALATTSSLRGRSRDDLFAEALEHESALDLSPLGRWPRVFKARALLWAGHLDEAHAIFLAMQKHAVSLGSEFQRPYRLHDIATVNVASGDLIEASGRARDGIEAARDAGNEQAIAWLAHPLGLAAALQGDAPHARWAAGVLSDWAATTDEPPRQAMADEILGNLATTQGDWVTARRHFDAMLEQLDAIGYAHPGARPALPRAIEAATMTGDGPRAHALLQQLTDQAEALGVPLIDAQLGAARGQLALVEGEGEIAVGHLEAAASAFDRLGFRFDAARTRLQLARALLRCGRRSRAHGCALAARDFFLTIQAPDWAAVASALLTRSGAPHAPGSLTPTELQIAQMVATGRTNREIAGELFISTSTVEAHLTRIYRKLDLRGRTALTTWMHAAAS